MIPGPSGPVPARRVRAGAGRGAERIDGNRARVLGMVMARPTERLVLTTPIHRNPRTPNQEGRAPHVRCPSASASQTRGTPAGAANPIGTSGPPRIVDTRLRMWALKRARKPDSSFLRRTKSSGPRSATRGRRHQHRHRAPARPASVIGERSRVRRVPTTPIHRRHRERRSGVVGAAGIVRVRARVAQAHRRVVVPRTRVGPTTGRVRRVAW